MKRKGQFFFLINEGCLHDISNALEDNSIKTICLNDSSLCPDKDYIILDGLIKETPEEKSIFIVHFKNKKALNRELNKKIKQI